MVATHILCCGWLSNVNALSTSIVIHKILYRLTRSISATPLVTAAGFNSGYAVEFTRSPTHMQTHRFDSAEEPSRCAQQTR